MKLQTKYFGQVEYDRDEVLTFAEGLFGFEDEREFLLLPFRDSGGALLCLQSVSTPALAFVVMDPFALDPGYFPVLQPQELSALGVQDSRELGYYVLCVLRKPVSDSTVNLKCPVAVHPDTRAARQVILDSDAYEMRHLLNQFGGKGAAPC